MFWQILKKIPSDSGFTLLELIIVFSVMSIMSTIGIAAFVSYSKSQTLQAAYLDLLNTLTTAKSYSISQLKPTECGTDPLEGYKVAFDLLGSKNDYSFYAECQGYEKLLKHVVFPKNVTFNSFITTNPSITFPLLSSDVTDCSPIDCSITIVGYNDQRTITVTGAGIIIGSQTSSVQSPKGLVYNF